MGSDPKTLQEAIQFFADPKNCREYLVARRWPDGVTCPRCGSKNVLFLEKYNRWHCREKHDAPQFTLKTGTIMEDSPIGLDKWMLAMWQIVNCKNGISSYEIHRAIGVTQKTAWFLDHRIRYALSQGTFETKLGGPDKGVEVDETFIGGKVKNMHKGRKVKAQKDGRNLGNKVTVLGVLQRGGKVRTSIVADRQRETITSFVRDHVEPESTVYSDEHGMQWMMPSEYTHWMINHAIEYVRGQVHTNGIENFWALVKRGIHGTYVSVEPFHLFRYLDEQMFRYNHRKDENDQPLKDGDRFDLAVRMIVGKRLTWDQLTGKESEMPTVYN